MAFKLFGYKIGKEEAESEQLKSFVPSVDEDGSVPISGGGIYGTYMDLEGQIRSDSDLIKKYREMALQPECDTAIEDIVNESLVFEDGDYPVQIILDKLEQPESIKKKIRDEYHYIMKLLDFNNQGYDIFRRWYVDGRLYYHMVIDEKNPRSGLKEVRYIDPRKIRKVRENKRTDNRPGTADTSQQYHEYFIYSDKGFARDGSQGIKIAVDSVCYTNSGITDKDMYLPKLPDWPSKKTNNKPPSPCWWPEILDLKKRDLLRMKNLENPTGIILLFQKKNIEMMFSLM